MYTLKGCGCPMTVVLRKNTDWPGDILIPTKTLGVGIVFTPKRIGQASENAGRPPLL